ncbi:MAG: polysaccharide biosynthesis C-terminal domain-containing protein [Crocinitomicaceae bacterium]
MGIIQRDAFRTMIISYLGLVLGYLNKGVLFVIILQTDQIGLINLLISIGLLFSQFASLGVVNTTWKFFPYFRNEDRNNYGFLKLVVIIALIGSVITALLAIIFGDTVTSFYAENSSEFIKYYYWIIPIGVANVFYLLFENYLRGLYKNLFPAFVYEILFRLTITGLLFALYFKTISFEEFLIGNSLSFFIPLLLLLIYLIRLGEIKSLRTKIQVPKRFKSIIVKYGLFSYTNSLGAMVVTTLDIAMIASMIGLSGAGVYSTVIYLTSALQVPYRSIIRVSVPFVSLYWKEKKIKEMNTLYRNVSTMSLIIGGYLFTVVWANRIELFSFLPKEFEAGILVFLFLMIGKLFDMYMGINSMILNTSKKYRVDILFTFVMILLVGILNYLFIPIYGISGAAISTMLALIVYNLLRLIYVWYHYKIHPFQLNQIVIILLIFAVIALGEFTPDVSSNTYLNLFVKSSMVSMAFGIPMLLFRIEPKLNDYLKKFVNRLKPTSQKP